MSEDRRTTRDRAAIDRLEQLYDQALAEQVQVRAQFMKARRCWATGQITEDDLELSRAASRSATARVSEARSRLRQANEHRVCEGDPP